MDLQAITQLLLAAVADNNRDKAIPEAVQKLSAQAQSSGSEIGDFVCDVYNAIFDTSAQLPVDKQSALVEFILQLRQVAVSDANGQPLSHEGGRIWTDLPTFGWVARDLWNFDALAPLPDGQLAKLERQSTFLAQLTALSDVNHPKDPLNFSLFGLWALRTAFEDAPQDTNSANAVQLAAPWINHAGSTLWKLSQNHDDVPGNAGAGGQTYVDKGWKGFSKERWGVWKGGFVTAKSQSASSLTTDLAKAAVDVMEKVSA